MLKAIINMDVREYIKGRLKLLNANRAMNLKRILELEEVLKRLEAKKETKQEDKKVPAPADKKK